ncbi:MAG TPA: hypothetical protein VGM05_23990 [Planctomycetaceae bacterium]|jgi:hypothetical protein
MHFKLQTSISYLVVACLFPCSVLRGQERQPEKSAAGDGVKAWYAFYHHEAAHAYRFNLEPGHVELELDPTPILRWTNPLEEGSIHGVAYVWRNKGRPVVVGQLFSYLNGKAGRVYCHAVHSLARPDEQVTGLRDGKTFWTPDSPGVEMRDVPEAPKPAANRAGRLAQLKAIARRFSAYTEEATRGKRELRLLPTPLDRYPENAADGALFSLVVGNDPEVILLVEQGEKPAGGSIWRFGLILSTRSTSVAMLDGREVWRYDSTGKNPSDPHGGYLSVHGIATLPLEPPARPADNP